MRNACMRKQSHQKTYYSPYYKSDYNIEPQNFGANMFWDTYLI
jgi:hypothetical protein